MELFHTFLAGLLVGGVAGTVVTAFTISMCVLAKEADERAGYE